MAERHAARVSPAGPGILCRHRRGRGQARASARCCRQFVDAGGRRRAPGSRSSRPRRRWARRSSSVYAALFDAARRAAEVTALRPETRARGQRPGSWSPSSTASTGIFMTGGNQLKLSARHRRHPRSATRSVDAHAARRRPSAARRPAPASSPRTWSPSGRAARHPKQRMTQLAAGLGLRRGLRDRPALRPAQPLRPAADARRPVARSLLGHGRRRGHRRAIITDGHAMLEVDRPRLR